MSRYRAVRKQNLSDEHIQRGWASLDQIAFDQIVNGYGEYLSEPIYFGRAFDSPPQFTFSAVQDFDTTNAEVKAIEVPARGLMQASGPAPNGRRDTRQAGGWVKDPSFELQGVWDSYIPRVWEHTTWTNYQKIQSENPLNTSPHYGTFRNFWVQGLAAQPSLHYWSITDTKTAKAFVGSASEYSATCIVNDDGYTPWLSPMMYPIFTPWEPLAASVPVEAIWPMIWSWLHPVNYVPDVDPTYPEGFVEIKHPSQGQANWSMKLWSSEQATVETYCNVWMNDTATEQGYFYDNIKDETITHDLPAGEWTTIEHRFVLPDTIWPTDPYWSGDSYLGGFRFRVASIPGATIYADEIYGWPNLTSRQQIPFITIGVAEWVRDEQDMYVGAILWYKVTNGAQLA